MSYRINTPFYIPRRKADLIKAIYDSKKWSGTKTTLNNMPTPQLKAIFIKIRQDVFNDFMKKQSEPSAIKGSNSLTGGL